MYNLQRAYGVWYNVLGFVRTSNFVPKPLGRFVNCELLIVNCYGTCTLLSTSVMTSSVVMLLASASYVSPIR